MEFDGQRPLTLVLLDGERPVEGLLHSWAHNSDTIFAADGAAQFALDAGIQLDALVGDFDSISSETLNRFTNIGTELIRIEEQESNDFEKILRVLSTRDCRSICILGLTGKRPDHALANFSVMLKFAPRFEWLHAFDNFGEHWLATPNRPAKISCKKGGIISLMPFGHADRVRTANLQYPLSGDSLLLGERVGLSNLATASEVTVTLESGALLVSILNNSV